MTEHTPPKTTGRNQAGRWQPGASGNAAGRPRGARHEALLALDAIGAEAGKDIMAAVVDAAKRGDVTAAGILLKRLWPERRGRPVLLHLPPMTSAADLPAAIGTIAAAVAGATLTPDEGQAIAAVIELQRRAFETADHETRIVALEQNKGTSR
jgi:hypothetical protein